MQPTHTRRLNKKRTPGVKFSAGVQRPKMDDLHTVMRNDAFHQLVSQQVLEIIYSYCDVWTLLNAHDVCNFWRQTITSGDLITSFESQFKKETEELIHINNVWTDFNQFETNKDYWRSRLFIRHACLLRAREALGIYITHRLLSEFESSSSKFHSNEYKFREDLLQWSERDENEKNEFHKSLLNEAENFGRRAIKDHTLWDTPPEPIQEYWELDKNQIGYSGKLMSFYVEIKVKCGGSVDIQIDEVNQDKFSKMHRGLDEGNDLSLSFVNENKFSGHK
jgi:hypothetical protein